MGGKAGEESKEVLPGHYSGKSSVIRLNGKEWLLSNSTAGLRSPQEIGSACV